MKPKVYLETTIPSYLTARPSRDLVMAANQEITHEWWEQVGRVRFVYFATCCARGQGGDPEAAAKRLDVIQDLPLLEETAEVLTLAQAILAEVPLPDRAVVNALHIAVSAVHGMDYLVTWNCTHIANASLRLPIESVCREHGYEPPVICTPDELLQLEDQEMDSVVQEVREIREAYARQFGYDLQAIHRDLRKSRPAAEESYPCRRDVRAGRTANRA